MSAQHALLLTTARGDLCLVTTYLKEVDSCLGRVALSPEDRLALVQQMQILRRQMERIDLWISVGTSDLDEELAHLTDGQA